MSYDVVFSKILNFREKLKKNSKTSDLQKVYSYAKKIVEINNISNRELFELPLKSALIIAEMYFNENMIIVCILQRLVVDNYIKLEDVEDRFGKDIRDLLENLMPFLQVKLMVSGDAEQMETIRRMLMSLLTDMRIIFVKLANYIAYMAEIDTFEKERQEFIAKKAIHIFVPLADRLGIWNFKSRLEDLAFRFLHADEAKELQDELEDSFSSTNEYIDEMEANLVSLFDENNFKALKIKGRVKNLYSIYRKMHLKKKTLDEIHDIFAIRVIVDNVVQCYEALGFIHSKWMPMPNRIKDYISMPKINGYKSLHTTVRGIDGRPTEIQIRTKKMDEDSEFGMAAHFVYSAEKKELKPSTEQQEWLDKIKALQEEVDLDEIGEVNLEMFSDRIFVFSPKGDVYELAKNSSPIDFAYAIHSDLGDKCVGAKINDKMQSLYTPLKNGDLIEVLTSNKSPGPRHEWLQHVKSQKAKNKIRAFLKNLDRDIHIKDGLNLLEAELKRVHAKLTKTHKKLLLERFNYDDIEDIYVSIGDGSLSISSVLNAILFDDELFKSKKSKRSTPIRVTASEVVIEEDEDIEYTLAKCCNPRVGDYILGYTALNSGIKVHNINCPQVKFMDPERIMSAWWKSDECEKVYPIKVLIKSVKNRNIFQDVMLGFMDNDYPILDATMKSLENNLLITIETNVSNYNQIKQIFLFIEAIPGILDIKSI